MNNRRGRKKRGYTKIYSSIPPLTYTSIEKEANRRGLDISDIIREILMERFGQGNNVEEK